MIYALVISHIVWAALAVLFVRASHKVLEAERVWHKSAQESLLNRIQAPQVAVAQSLPDMVGPAPYVSSTDDVALAEFEEQRRRLTVPAGAE